MNNLSLISLIVVGCNIYLMYDLTYHNGYKDGDQNIDFPNDWFFDNENIWVCLQLEFVCIYIFLQLQFMCTDVGLQVAENLLR